MVWDFKINFILFETPVSGQVVFSEMLKLGIILRPVDNYGLPNHLRMSVGLESENKKAIQCLKKVFGKIKSSTLNKKINENVRDL